MRCGREITFERADLGCRRHLALLDRRVEGDRRGGREHPLLRGGGETDDAIGIRTHEMLLVDKVRGGRGELGVTELAVRPLDLANLLPCPLDEFVLALLDDLDAEAGCGAVARVEIELASQARSASFRASKRRSTPACHLPKTGGVTIGSSGTFGP